jgi:hypothetical protein
MRVRDALVELGLDVEIRAPREGTPEWLALATHVALLVEESLSTRRAELEAITATFGGEYDGWEAAIGP